jgi:hypothetical protein
MSLNFLQQCGCQCRLKQKLYILEVMNRPKCGAVRQFCGLLLHYVCVVSAGWGRTNLQCVTLLLCYWYNVQLVVKTQQHLLRCIVRYVIQLHVSAYFRPSSGSICLALRVLYHDDKLDYFDDDISIIVTYDLLLWRVYRQFNMEGSGLGCGMAAMDNVVSCLRFFSFLFCSSSRGITFLILPYPWVSATGLVFAWICL